MSEEQISQVARTSVLTALAKQVPLQSFTAFCQARTLTPELDDDQS